MITVRQGVFETNSSSSHSLTMCNKNDYDAWKNGKLLLNAWGSRSSDSEYADNNFVTVDEAIDVLSKNVFHADEIESLKRLTRETNDSTELMDYLYENEFLTYEQYDEKASYFEDTFEDYYVTKSGETIVAFGYYGHD